MRKKNNNAVEKVEKIAGESKRFSPETREEERAEKRIEIARMKEERKNKKQEYKLKRKSEGKGNGGWVAAVITLSIATLVLASVLTYSFLMPSENDSAIESVYQKSFYDTVDQVDNMDLNMSKLLATKDKGAMQVYLMDLAVNSELCENDLQQLPIEDESKYNTTKLVNQIGDFAKYINKKLSNGESLSDEDYAGLIRLYQANMEFKNSLKKITDNMEEDFTFSSMSDSTNNIVISNFNELENLSVSYPELIYDGPFSDGITQREIKGLSGEEINENKAVEIFTEIFNGYGLEDVMYLGEVNGDIFSYGVQATVKGENLYAQISKVGGRLIMFSYSGSCNEINYEQAKAEENAQNFLSAVGLDGLKPVWINRANNVYTINFAYDLDGITVYSDLVKIRVCAETGMIIGMEGTSYYTNHTERTVSDPEIGKEVAMEKVSQNIDINSSRLAIIPIGVRGEKLCYEFSGEYDGATYYVYIDAVSGRQVEMFKVIEGTEGTLLM